MGPSDWTGHESWGDLVETIAREESWYKVREELSRQFKGMAKPDRKDRYGISTFRYKHWLANVVDNANEVGDLLIPLLDRKCKETIYLKEFQIGAMSCFLKSRRPRIPTTAHEKARRQLLFSYYSADGKPYLNEVEWNAVVKDGFSQLMMKTNSPFDLKFLKNLPCSIINADGGSRDDELQDFGKAYYRRAYEYRISKDNQITYRDFYEAFETGVLPTLSNKLSWNVTTDTDTKKAVASLLVSTSKLAATGGRALAASLSNVVPRLISKSSSLNPSELGSEIRVSEGPEYEYEPVPAEPSFMRRIDDKDESESDVPFSRMTSSSKYAVHDREMQITTTAADDDTALEPKGLITAEFGQTNDESTFYDIDSTEIDECGLLRIIQLILNPSKGYQSENRLCKAHLIELARAFVERNDKNSAVLELGVNKDIDTFYLVPQINGKRHRLKVYLDQIMPNGLLPPNTSIIFTGNVINLNPNDLTDQVGNVMVFKAILALVLKYDANIHLLRGMKQGLDEALLMICHGCSLDAEDAKTVHDVISDTCEVCPMFCLIGDIKITGGEILRCISDIVSGFWSEEISSALEKIKRLKMPVHLATNSVTENNEEIEVDKATGRALLRAFSFNKDSTQKLNSEYTENVAE